MATGKSGDSLLKVNTYVLTEEMNSYTILQNMDAKCFYERSIVWLYIISQTPATTGADYTNNNYVMDHDGNRVKHNSFSQESGKKAPSELLYCGGTTYSDAPASIDSDGRYNWRRPTATVMAPVGAIAVTMEYPLPDPNTGVLDTTPWGG